MRRPAVLEWEPGLTLDHAMVEECVHVAGRPAAGDREAPGDVRDFRWRFALWLSAAGS